MGQTFFCTLVLNFASLATSMRANIAIQRDLNKVPFKINMQSAEEGPSPLVSQSTQITFQHTISEFEKVARGVAVPGSISFGITVLSSGDETMRELIDSANEVLCDMYTNQIFQTFGTRAIYFHFVDRIAVVGEGQSKIFSVEKDSDEDPATIYRPGQKWFALAGHGPIPGHVDLTLKADSGHQYKFTADNTDSVLEVKKALCIATNGQLAVKSIKLFSTAETKMRDISDEARLGSLTLPKSLQLKFAYMLQAGDSSQLEPGTLEKLTKAGKFSIINHLEPALKLIIPCKLDSMFRDFADRGYASELARLARLLWKREHAVAADNKIFGHVSETFFMLMHTPGETVAEKVNNYIERLF